MPDQDQHEGAATPLFADIAGFTALTEAHGGEEAAKLVAEFSDAVGETLGPERGQTWPGVVRVGEPTR